MKVLILAAMSAVISMASAAEKAAAVYTIPVRVHLVTGTEFKEGGQSIEMWLTPEDFKKSVLPEMNRIWKPAGIQWKLESIVIDNAENK